MKTWITYLLCFIVTAIWTLVQLDSMRNHIGLYVFACLAFNLALVLVTQHSKTAKEKVTIYLMSLVISFLALLAGALVFGLIWASIGKIGG